MAKKHLVYLPSLKERTEDGKAVPVPLLQKLEKRNVLLLKQHGYMVKENVKSVMYKLLPPSAFSPFLLFVYMLFQDLFRGTPFNSERYPFFLLFKEYVYDKKLSTEEKQIVVDYMKTSNKKRMQIGGVSIDVDKLLNSSEQTQSTEPVVPAKPKVILIASDGAGVGKSTFSNALVEHLGKDKAYPFAFMTELRLQLSMILSMSGLDPDIFVPENYNRTKNKSHSYSEDTQPFVLRDLVCEYSDLLQKYLGKDIWAKLANDTIDYMDAQYFIIDDLRRPIELEYLRKHVGVENILTVYLSKEGAATQMLSDSSKGYEGLLNKDDFDINFTFNADWSNTPDLLKTITERL